MQVDPYIVIGSAVVGLLVGLTGAGGGALMTPMLILLFKVTPPAAISSDLVAAVVMRPVGAAVHLRKGTVNLKMVGWLAAGSVPMAFVGAYFLHLLGNTKSAQTHVEQALGAALLAGAAAMVARYVLDIRGGSGRTGAIKDVVCKPLPTLAIGMLGGVIVGMTSVGSGSLMIVLMLFLYPTLSANRLVGTDLTQAVPLTAAAAVGALVFGSVQFGVTTSIIIGSVPAVLVGSFLSSRAPDRFIRPAITFVIFASGLKYAGVGTTTLGWILCVVLIGGAIGWLAWAKPWINGRVAEPGHLAALVRGSPDGARPQETGDGQLMAEADGIAPGRAPELGAPPGDGPPDGSGMPDGQSTPDGQSMPKKSGAPNANGSRTPRP